jgi:uncharacterized membrane protein YedE/YeeE
VSGALIGLMVPVLLMVGGKVFGLSSNLRHLCAAMPVSDRLKPALLRYDWKRTGLWNLVFMAGIAAGGALAVLLFGVPDVGAHLSDATRVSLAEVGLGDPRGMIPETLFSWRTLTSPVGLLLVVLGGFLVGFGARYAGGCTSGHAISGLAALQLPSLVAVIGFFAGGLLITHLVYPWLLPLLLR